MPWLPVERCGPIGRTDNVAKVVRAYRDLDAEPLAVRGGVAIGAY